MEKAKGFEANCSGCGACYAVCPKNAVTIELDEKGFFTAKKNENCIDCGLCAKVCINNTAEEYLDFNFKRKYSAYIRDTEIHTSCASGGGASGFYLYALKMGFKAVGAYYNLEKNICEMKIAGNIQEVRQFRGSKYIQPYCAEILKQIVCDKERYIVCGLPCQIYGLRRASRLLNCEDRFLFVDICCHGVPSYLVWRRHIAEITQNRKVLTVSFRDHEHGWHKNFLKIGYETGNYIRERKKDNFYKIFDDSYLMSDACYTCDICQRRGISDIRLGDLWDTSLCKDGKFRSVVLIGTKRGQDFFDASAHQFVTEEIEIVLPEKNQMPEHLPEIRKVAFNELKKGRSLKQVIGKYRAGESFKRKAIRNHMIVKTYLIVKRLVGRQ